MKQVASRYSDPDDSGSRPAKPTAAPPTAPLERLSWWSGPVVAIGLLLACFAFYRNSLIVPFLFDDQPAIHEAKESMKSPGAFFSKAVPVVNLSTYFNSWLEEQVGPGGDWEKPWADPRWSSRRASTSITACPGRSTYSTSWSTPWRG